MKVNTYIDFCFGSWNFITILQLSNLFNIDIGHSCWH